MSIDRTTLETSIREALDRGELERAATRALEGYGPEVLGYLLGTLASEQDASEVFSMVSEDLWRGLAGFRGESSFRTWLYCLARNATMRYRRAPHRRRARNQPLSHVDEVAQRVRTETLPHLRTDAKVGLAKLRASLALDDQTLLILRVDRKMSWDEVTQVLHPEEAEDPKARARVCARLRKRMQLLKKELRERAIAEGLLDDGA